MLYFFLAKEALVQNKTLEEISIGDNERVLNDVGMNLPTNVSRILSENYSDNSKENEWCSVICRMVPIISVVVYTFSYGAGFGPAIYTWTSGLFPSKMKGVGSSIAMAR